MSILNILLSIREVEDVKILGQGFSFWDFISITTTFFIPFIYGVFSSHTKGYYLSVLMFIWCWTILMYFQGLLITISTEKYRILIPISDFPDEFSFFPLTTAACLLISFIAGLFIKYLFNKYRDHQFAVALGLIAFAFILILSSHLIAELINEFTLFYKEIISEPKVMQTSGNAPVRVPGLAAHIIMRDSNSIMLTSFYLTLFGISSSIYIYLKNRKKHAKN